MSIAGVVGPVLICVAAIIAVAGVYFALTALKDRRRARGGSRSTAPRGRTADDGRPRHAR